jgi:uncharacterized protein (TIGR04255 family)
MTERRQYKNPPILEALCEISFAPSKPWNATVPGKLHSLVINSYGGEPRQQQILETELLASPTGRPNFRFKEGFGKVQLPTLDGTRLLAIGEDVLSVHIMQPYQAGAHLENSGWTEFRERISQAIDAYWEVAFPKGVSRIGLRYINLLEAEGEKVTISDYIRSGPHDIPGLPDQMIDFKSRDEYIYDDGIRLVISQGLAPAPRQEVAALLLDIDLICVSEEILDREQALAMADDLRERERVVFELLITDKSRSAFNA